MTDIAHAFQDPDIATMLRFQAGDMQAFEQLVSKHQRHVLNLIYRYLGNAAQAEDAAQEVFFKVYRAQKTYTPKAKFSTWLFRVTANHCLNEIRARKTQPVSLAPVDDLTEQPDGVNPNDRMERLEIRSAVKQALDGLPDNQRLAVILARYEDMSYEDIAATMKLSLEAVKSILHRAKESLKEKLVGLLKR